MLFSDNVCSFQSYVQEFQQFLNVDSTNKLLSQWGWGDTNFGFKQHVQSGGEVLC